jgi:serine/threonine-protein kinase HipA
VLPDKYGNTLINAWLARQGRPENSMNPAEMLCYIGKRGMGALEFEPSTSDIKNSSTQIEIENLVLFAKEVLGKRKNFATDLNRDEEKALIDILKIGTSAGGARAKAVVAFNPVTQEVRSGQTDAPVGFSHWLLKFDGISDQQIGSSHGYGRVEMAYHLMATACGIEMTECRLLEENGRAHFMTRRFDRPTEKTKIHFQSLCAIAHYDFQNITSYSYEQLFQVMRLLRLPYPAAEQMFRRMVFNVIARNCDDHTKNFGFAMDQSGAWSLAPAFDVCHAYRPGSFWVSQQSLSVNGKRQNISREDLLVVAKQMNIKKANQIVNEINDEVNNWKKYATQTGVDSKLISSIEGTFLWL